MGKKTPSGKPDQVLVFFNKVLKESLMDIVLNDQSSYSKGQIDLIRELMRRKSLQDGPYRIEIGLRIVKK